VSEFRLCLISFLAWGLYHGGLLIFERATGLRRVEPGRTDAARRVVTFVLVLFGWALFRSGSLGEAALFIRAMFAPVNLPLPVEVSLALNARNVLFLALSSIVLLLPREFSLLSIFDEKRPALSLALTAGLFVLALYSFSFIAGGSFNPFIYFRF